MEILIPISLLLVIFGMYYLYITSRNRERLALIEKGLDASFLKKDIQHTMLIWKFLILNTSLLLIGIGIGIFTAFILSYCFSIESEAIYPAIIFFMAGISLFVGFQMTKKTSKI